MMRRFIILFLFAIASARADTASRLYQQGKYDEALERYRKAAQQQPENWPLFYDLGAAAYKAGRPDEAASAFERALGSKDTTLQAKALYNLGNSYFRLGEAAEKQSREQAMPQYEHSLKSYENSLAIEPHDEDGKFNLDMVKKKIEELKKQQQQNQNQQQNQQDQQQQQNQNQQKNNRQEQQQQNQQQSGAEKQKQQDQQNPQQQQAAKEKQETEPQQQQDQQRQQQQQAKNGQPENYEKMQATALLDNLREDEKNWNFFPELMSKTNELSEPAKDW